MAVLVRPSSPHAPVKRACPQSPPRSYAFPLHTGPCWHLVRSQRRPPSRACRFLPMAAAAASRSSPASLLDVCTWGSQAHLKRNLHNVDDCAWPRRPRPPSSRTPTPMANGFTMSSRTLLHRLFQVTLLPPRSRSPVRGGPFNRPDQSPAHFRGRSSPRRWGLDWPGLARGLLRPTGLWLATAAAGAGRVRRRGGAAGARGRAGARTATGA